MALDRPLPQSLFPDLPRTRKFLDKEGNILPEWKLFLDQLVLALQTTFTSEGWLIPLLTIDQINGIQAKYAPYIGLPLPPGVRDITGLIAFDSTNNVTKQFIIIFNNAVNPPTVVSAQWYTFAESPLGSFFELLGP